MGLIARLNWYDKTTQISLGKEYSEDLGDDDSIINALGLMKEREIYDGGFDVKTSWIPNLQSLFDHELNTDKFDYQVAFRYRTA